MQWKNSCFLEFIICDEIQIMGSTHWQAETLQSPQFSSGLPSFSTTSSWFSILKLMNQWFLFTFSSKNFSLHASQSHSKCRIFLISSWIYNKHDRIYFSIPCVIVIGQSRLSSLDCITTKWTCKHTQRDDENTTCCLFC